MPLGEDRDGEPLRAAWKPVPARKPARRAGPGRRVFVVVALLVLTGFVVVDAVAPSAAPAVHPAAAAPPPPHPSVVPTGVPENPAPPPDLTGSTAELPAGGEFTPTGRGTWHVVPGSGPKVGTGRLYRYTVEVEDGIDPAFYAGDDAFGAAVEGILSDPASWTAGGGVALQRVDGTGPADFRVSLTTPGTTHHPTVCGYSITYESSCFRRSLHRVVINLARWVRGAKAYGANLTAYREYAINHEVGHALGHSHVGCGGDGAPAPVMMQQTFGVADDYVAGLNNVPGGDRGSVPADHRVCAPNPWPFPPGQ